MGEWVGWGGAGLEEENEGINPLSKKDQRQSSSFRGSYQKIPQGPWFSPFLRYHIQLPHLYDSYYFTVAGIDWSVSL